MYGTDVPLRAMAKFVKGQSGNPLGRPSNSDSIAEVFRSLREGKIDRAVAEEVEKIAFDEVTSPLRDLRTGEVIGVEKVAVTIDQRLRALDTIMDRAWGKSVQPQMISQQIAARVESVEVHMLDAWVESLTDDQIKQLASALEPTRESDLRIAAEIAGGVSPASLAQIQPSPADDTSATVSNGPEGSESE